MPHTYFRVDYQSNGVVEVVLNRAAQFNVVDDKFFEELYSILSEIEANEAANVVLLWAEGKLFTAGLDLAYAAQNLMPTNQGASVVCEVVSSHFKNGAL
jgi:enoyl-CoA hydratase/carnithine racemase